jgi:hypothetical protein
MPRIFKNNFPTAAPLAWRFGSSTPRNAQQLRRRGDKGPRHDITDAAPLQFFDP